MKVCFTAVLSTLVLLSPGTAAQAQAKAAKPALTGKAKESLEAQFARQNFKQVLDAVNDAWFGKAYAGVNAVDLSGTMTINLSAAAMNAQVEQMGQGAVKGGLTKGATVNLACRTRCTAASEHLPEFSKYPLVLWFEDVRSSAWPRHWNVTPSSSARSGIPFASRSFGLSSRAAIAVRPPARSRRPAIRARALARA